MKVQKLCLLMCMASSSAVFADGKTISDCADILTQGQKFEIELKGIIDGSLAKKDRFHGIVILDDDSSAKEPPKELKIFKRCIEDLM